MHRARARDQRFVAGIGCRALVKCLCMEPPLVVSIARETRAFHRLRGAGLGIGDDSCWILPFPLSDLIYNCT